MKTTVKIDQHKSVVVLDATAFCIPVELCTFGVKAFGVYLTPDQAGVLGQALMEQAQIAELIGQGKA